MKKMFAILMGVMILAFVGCGVDTEWAEAFLGSNVYVNHFGEMKLIHVTEEVLCGEGCLMDLETEEVYIREEGGSVFVIEGTTEEQMEEFTAAINAYEYQSMAPDFQDYLFLVGTEESGAQFLSEEPTEGYFMMLTGEELGLSMEGQYPSWELWVENSLDGVPGEFGVNYDFYIKHLVPDGGIWYGPFTGKLIDMFN